MPRALMRPPGVPDFLTRRRFVEAGPCRLEGRAWSGWGQIERVEVSTDGGATWADAALGDAPGPHAWRAWSLAWTPPGSGDYERQKRMLRINYRRARSGKRDRYRTAVARIDALAEEGASIDEIAARLRADGFTPASGFLLGRARLRRILARHVPPRTA